MTQKTKRRTLVDILLFICLDKFKNDGWTIIKNLQGSTAKRKLLAETTWETKTIEIFPVLQGDPPPEQSLLHELIHIGLDLGKEYDTNNITYWLERYMWKRLSGEQKEILKGMLDFHG